MTSRSAASAAARFLAWGLLALVVLGFADALAYAVVPLTAFRLHLGVAAALVAALALAFRAWAVAAPAAAATALALATLGPVWDGPERPAAAEGHALTVLFANVRGNNPAPAAMQMALVAADADVVVVAEASQVVRRADAPLVRAYPHRLMLPADDERTRIALYSRLALEEATLWPDRRGAWPVVSAVVRPGGETRLAILGVHLSHGPSGRVPDELGALGRLADTLAPPRVVVGDFNAPLWSRTLEVAAERTGTEPAEGYRVTWRGLYPWIEVPARLGHQIDHLLVSPGIGIAGLETVEVPGSDHLGLLARLVVPPKGAAMTARAGLLPATGRGYAAPATR